MRCRNADDWFYVFFYTDFYLKEKREVQMKKFYFFSCTDQIRDWIIKIEKKNRCKLSGYITTKLKKKYHRQNSIAVKFDLK